MSSHIVPTFAATLMPTQIERESSYTQTHYIYIQYNSSYTLRHTCTHSDRERDKEGIMPCCEVVEIANDHMPMFCGESELNIAKHFGN